MRLRVRVGVRVKPPPHSHHQLQGKKNPHEHLKEARGEIESLQRELGEFRHSKDAVREECNRLKTMLRMAERAGEAGETAEVYQVEKDMCLAESEALRESNLEMESNMREMELEKKESETKVEELRALLEEAVVETGTCNIKLKHVSGEKKAAEEEVEKLNGGLKAAETKIEALREEVTRGEAANKEGKSLAYEAEERFRSLEKKIRGEAEVEWEKLSAELKVVKP